MSAPSRHTRRTEAIRLAAHPERRRIQPIDNQALSRRFGSGHRILGPDADPGSPLLAGHFTVAQVRDGLYMHCTDIDHLRELRTRSALLETGIKVLLRLEGNAGVKLGGRPLPLDAGQGPASRPRGAVVALAEPVEFERHCTAGVRERMVVITLTEAWFASAGQPFPTGLPHLAIRRWLPSPRSLAVAEQLIRPPEFDGPMHALLQESRALELIAEALTQAGEDGEAPAQPLPPAAYRRVESLRKLLDSGQADELDMSAIAQHIGCNPNTLQQQFRQTYGQTIFEYLREQRLLRAARALQQEGISVGRAAEIAGYNSQGNFSTAFSRHFGLSPKHFRLKI